jgi:hypothetical protein
VKEAHSYRVHVQERIDWTTDINASSPQEALQMAREAFASGDRIGWQRRPPQSADWLLTRGLRRWIAA